MKRWMMGLLGLCVVACKPARVFVVAAPAQGLELSALELDVDRVVLDGCRGKSKSFVVDDTLDLLQPTGIELPRGEWCGLTLRTPDRKNDRPTLRLAGLLAPDTPFHLEAGPSEARVDQKFELRKGKQAVLLNVGQWLDLTQLQADVQHATERHPETGDVLIQAPVTSALLATVELSAALSIRPKKKLDSDTRALLDDARSRSTSRWRDASQSEGSGCNGNGCTSDGDSGSSKSDDSGASGDDSGGGYSGGDDSGVEKSCGDGCGSGDGCTDSGDSGGYGVDSGMLVPGVLGLFALARRRRRS